MGLLTDPTAGQGRFVKLLLKYCDKICALMYIVGILWFCSLAYPAMNANTYFSENALLPGLVKTQFREDKLALTYHEELLDEMKKYDDSIPYPWLLAKFRQIGLDVFVHNFTLNSPLNKKERYTGQNVYGILRAPRAASVESLVLSVPYRPPTSVHQTTSPSIAVMLAFAKFAAKEKYWAKDIIFLITEHEQLGIQAWLEAYHGVTCGNDDALDHGDLRGRGGAIQAAINLELHSEKIGQLDVKIEGLNGQLPNLDLFNLVSKMCSREGLYQTFKNRGLHYYRNEFKEWWRYFRNTLAMMATQASGIPNGNHGLFHRFGIQALTLEGFEQTKAAKSSMKVGMLSLGRIIESIFRSLNNLLERFHQSFFFYLLPASDRYISIGLYMPAVSLIAGALFIKAFAKWLKLQGDSDSLDNKSASFGQEVEPIKIIVTFISIHLFSIGLLYMPQLVSEACETYDCPVNRTIFYALLTTVTIAILIPFLIFGFFDKSIEILNVFAMLELGTALICISMTNFSLGMFCAVLSVPFTLWVGRTNSRIASVLQTLFLLLIHPITVLAAVVLVNTYLMFPKDPQKEILMTAWDATQQAVIYSIADSMIYVCQ
ncbi:unnamed protein product [Acanthoscelides obtectus]|uniref:GPI-anchor transamidase component GPAA1 n=1 Tax=Acanthoscelides obtectus TaxID=200917 RepID=A0A9P0JY19_ACAOB|nr:unnamed protein product [Acanthoscelides obtectus]CAK1646084.1 Glycosylphosphatidylinositol anchor attachment 1 protein [Acanthoscelides obtectus]